MTDLISALALMYPCAKNSLALSRRSLKGWHDLVPSQSAVPLAKEFLLAFVRYLRSKDEIVCSVALALAWAGYLRGAEVLAIKRRDLALSGDIRVSQYEKPIAGINVLDAKTGPFQFDPIRDRDVLILLQAYLRSRSFPLSNIILESLAYRGYLQIFRLSAATFEMQSFEFTTDLGRIGGALHDFCQDVPAATIAAIGQWKTLSSLQCYLTNGRAWLLKLYLSRTAK